MLTKITLYLLIVFIIIFSTLASLNINVKAQVEEEEEEYYFLEDEYAENHLLIDVNPRKGVYTALLT